MTETCAVFAKGSNSLDDVRLDLDASFAAQEKWLENAGRRNVSKSRIRNYGRLVFFAIMKKIGLWNPLVGAGFIRYWLDEFLLFWGVLRGRPLSVHDFHSLRFHYRLEFHRVTSSKEYEWSSSKIHVEHWQRHEALFQVFHYALRYALMPKNIQIMPRVMGQNSRVLEYGCSSAPSYSCWKRYFSHINTKWVLADIANHSFFYAGCVHGRDESVTTHLIKPAAFAHPLKGIEGKFDVIFINEVFEHLDQPLHIANYLIDRLNDGGRLVFDYIISDAKGLDTTEGKAQRAETIQVLNNRLKIIYGKIGDASHSTGLCIGQKIK
jgi:hypothetical protein